jgi:hypothetical protein
MYSFDRTEFEQDRDPNYCNYCIPIFKQVNHRGRIYHGTRNYDIFMQISYEPMEFGEDLKLFLLSNISNRIIL